MDQADYEKWQRRKKARKLQKETGMKYTAALNEVIRLEEEEKKGNPDE